MGLDEVSVHALANMALQACRDGDEDKIDRIFLRLARLRYEGAPALPYAMLCWLETVRKATVGDDGTAPGRVNVVYVEDGNRYIAGSAAADTCVSEQTRWAGRLIAAYIEDVDEEVIMALLHEGLGHPELYLTYVYAVLQLCASTITVLPDDVQEHP